MYAPLGSVRLKGGEVVEAGVVTGPDADWADRVEDLLHHKTEVWRWQNAECLRRDLGLEVRFYLLHRDGAAFASILTATKGGVGHFGHVFTRPPDRRRGAASQLMGLQMAHFRASGGRALFLGTGYDSAPYHIYRSHGFRGLEAASGQMDYYAESAEVFGAAWFAPGPADLAAVGWPHWPTTAPLFTGDFPGTARCAPLGLFGRSSTEGAWLHLLHGEPARARVLVRRGTDAVVGAASWGPHPLWPHTALVDVYCHPAFWSRGPALLVALDAPAAGRCLALSDDGCPAKAEVLDAAGFRPTARFSGRLAVDAGHSRFVDATEWERG